MRGKQLLEPIDPGVMRIRGVGTPVEQLGVRIATAGGIILTMGQLQCRRRYAHCGQKQFAHLVAPTTVMAGEACSCECRKPAIRVCSWRCDDKRRGRVNRPIMAGRLSSSAPAISCTPARHMATSLRIEIATTMATPEIKPDSCGLVPAISCSFAHADAVGRVSSSLVSGITPTHAQTGFLAGRSAVRSTQATEQGSPPRKAPTGSRSQFDNASNARTWNRAFRTCVRKPPQVVLRHVLRLDYQAE